MTRAATLFTVGSFADPGLPGWRELLYPVVPLPEEWLSFPEVSASEGIGLSALLPLSSMTIPHVSAVGNLAVPPGDVDSMIDPGFL